MCKSLGIDLFIDDSPSQVKDALKYNINAYLMSTPYNKSESLKRITNWNEVFNILEELNDGKQK